jgi:hypothetical protein
MLIGTTTATIGIVTVRGLKLFHLAMGVDASYPGWSSSATRLGVSRHTTRLGVSRWDTDPYYGALG